MSAFVGRQKQLRYLEWNPPPAPFIPVHAAPSGTAENELGLNIAGPPLFNDGVLPRLTCLSSDFSFLQSVLDAGRGSSLRALQVNSSVLLGRAGSALLRELVGLEVLSLWSRDTPGTGWINVFSPDHAVLLPKLRNLECTIGRLEDVCNPPVFFIFGFTGLTESCGWLGTDTHPSVVSTS